MYTSMEEIFEKYDGQWVYLINCKKGEYGRTIGGDVVLMTKTLKELLDGMDKYENEKSETTFFGIPPKDTVFLL